MTKAEQVIQLICETGTSMKKACNEVGITPWSFLRAIERENLAQHYERAIDMRADMVFDEIFEIADQSENDTYVDDYGRVKTDHEVINRSRLRVDARKWALGKMNPKKYGDKLDLTSNNEPLPAPQIIAPSESNE